MDFLKKSQKGDKGRFLGAQQKTLVNKSLSVKVKVFPTETLLVVLPHKRKHTSTFSGFTRVLQLLEVNYFDCICILSTQICCVLALKPSKHQSSLRFERTSAASPRPVIPSQLPPSGG